MSKVCGRSIPRHLARRAACAVSFAATLFGGFPARAATEVWTGASGLWSTGANWQDGTAPLALGDATQALRFTYAGSAATTFQNDLTGTFSLNSLLLDHASPGLVTLSGQPLQFTGATPQINLRGAGSVSVSENLVLAAAGGMTSITGSGSGNLTLSGTISETGGANSLVIAASPTSPNVQSITLSGTNSFTDGVILQSGNLSANSAAALGAGPLTVQGGTLQLGSFTYANAISLQQRLVLRTSPTGNSVKFNGIISSAVAGTGLDVRSANAFITLTGANTFNGATTVDSSSLASEAIFAAARLRLTGNGTALNSSSFSISGGALEMDGATSGTIDRINDAAAINLRNAAVYYTSAGVSSTETVGPLSSAGYSTVTINLGSSNGNMRLVAASLNRVERGTYLFTALKLGQAFAAGVGNVLFTSAPTNLVGGSSTGANTSILPYAIGSETVSSPGTGLVTYSAATGVRLLTTSEYATDLATAQATHNVSLASAVNDVPRTVNALMLSGSLTGAGSLAITSGTVLASATDTPSLIGNDLAFGAHEANIFALNSLTVSGVVSGSAGLTLSGGGTLALTASNTFTGPLTVNGGVLSFSSATALGNDSSAIAAAGHGTGLTYTGAAPLNLARALETRGAVAGITTSGGDLTLGGVISGAGGLTLTGGPGRIILAGANTYAGPTVFAGGTTQFGSDAALGSGGALDFRGGTALLSGNWTTAREISVSTTGVLDTGGFSATWTGEFFGDGTFTKTGQGELKLTRTPLYSNTLTVSGGTVRLSDTAALRSLAYTLNGQGELVLDNSATVVGDRVNNGATVTLLREGGLRLTGNAAADVSETILSLVSTGATHVTLDAPGAFGTTLHLTNGLASASTGLLIRGANLGGAAGTAYTRVVSDTVAVPATLRLTVVADSSPTGGGESFTFYDSTSDAAGVIGYRPLRAAEYTSGQSIQNSANGGLTDPAAHYLAGSGSVAVGTANTVQSLTLEGGADLTLQAGQTLTVTTAGVLARAGATPTTISGGTLVFPTTANFYAAGDATFASNVSGNFRKTGPGVLTFDGTMGTGTVSVTAGTLRAGAGDPFATKTVSVGVQSTLSFASGNAVIAGVSGQGELAVGSGTVTIGQSSGISFSGTLSGTGNLVLADGGNASTTLSFSGAGSTFSGNVILNSGQLTVNDSTSLGNNATLVVNGGAVRSLFSSAAQVSSPVVLHTDLLVLGSSAFRFGPGATVTGAYDVILRGSGGLVVQGPLALPANLRSTYGLDDEFVTAPGNITVSGSQGSLTQAMAVQLPSGSTLTLDYTNSQTGGAAGRLGDTVPVQLTAASMTLSGNSLTSGLTEVTGSISSAGQSTLLISQFSSVAVTLQAAALTRVEHGTFLLNVGNNTTFGGAGTTSGGKFKLATPPALVGAGGTGVATSIVPWAFSSNGSFGLLTYDANGFRPLDATEMFSGLAAAPATANVQQSTPVANTATVTVNSLVLNGTGSLTGAGTLNITSGVVVGLTGTVENQLSFGGVEGQFSVPGSLTVTGVVSGSAGLTKSGSSTLTLAGHNTFTGPLALNNGTLAFTAPDNLGADSGTITVIGTATVLRMNAPGLVTLARPLRLEGGFPTLSSAGTFAVAGTVSGPGGLQIAGPGTVQLAAGNTYSGPTLVGFGATVAIADDSALGTGTGLFLATTSVVRLDGDWTTARRVELQGFFTINTNGHDALLNGLLTRSTPTSFLTKAGAGTLTLATDSTLSGTVSIKQGEFHLTEAGGLHVPNFNMSSGTALVLDNTTRAVANRLGTSVSVDLTGGQELRLLGNATADVQSAIGPFTCSGGGLNTIALTAPGVARAVLQATTISSTGVLVVRGDALGGGPAGAFTRFVATTAPANFAGLVPDSAGGFTLALYDATSDAAGAIGVRPLAPAEYTMGAEIRNALNGGPTPTTANFRVTGATPAGGAANSVNTLTFAGASSLSLIDGQTLSVLTPGVLVEAGGATIAGGRVAFTGGSGFFHTAGDLTLRSVVTAPVLNKTGPAQLSFEPAAPYSGAFNLSGGTLRAGAGNVLSGAAVAMSAGTTLDFASQLASVVSLKGAGSVLLGSSTLRLAADSSFSGDISGTGGLTALGTFEPFTAVSYTGPTSLGKTFFLRGAGTALGSSAFNILPAGDLQLDNSSQVLNRIATVPIALSSGTVELIGNTLAAVTQNAGLLTGAGVGIVNVDATGGRLPVALNFTGLARTDHATFSCTAGSGGVLGGGQATLTFGSAPSADLIGANTTATNRLILPYATTPLGTGVASLATYDPVTGVRPLLATEFSSTLTAGDNVLIATSQAANNTVLSINALVLDSFSITGTGALTVASGTVLSRTGSPSIAKNLAFGSTEAIFFTNVNLTVSSVISGSGGLTKSGPSTLTLSGANTFRGPLTVNAGTLSFATLVNLGPDTSEIVLGETAVLADTGANVTLARSLRLHGHATLAGPASAGTLLLTAPITGAGLLSTTGLVSLSAANTFTGDVQASGMLTINSDAALGAGSTLTLNGTLFLGGPWMTSRTLQTSGASTLNSAGFGAALPKLTGASSFTKTGAGLVTVADASSFTGGLTVAGGELRLQGVVPGSSSGLSVAAGGVLSGSWQSAQTLSVQGTLAPGDGAGAIASGSLTLQTSSTLAVEISSPVSYDQVSVTGSVALTGPVQLTLSLGYDPADLVDSFTLILNDGTDAVTFTNGGRFIYAGTTLNEGSTFRVNSQDFQISYAGGNGNDVVLTAIPEPVTGGLTLFGGLALAALHRRSRKW